MTDEAAAPAAAEQPGEPVDPSADPGPFRRAPWKVRLVLTVFSLAAVLVAGEGMARRFAPPEVLPTWNQHPLLGRVPTPGAAVAPNVPGDKLAAFAFDKLGLRGSSLKTRARPKDVFRILFLGDEQTFAAARPEPETFAGKVESELTKLRGPDDLKVEVGNAGLPGASLPVLYSHLLHRLLALEPDIVILTSAAQDVRLAQHLPPDDSLVALEPVPHEVPSFVDWLASVSDLARVVRSKAAPLEAPAPGTVQPLSPDTKRGLPLFRRYLHLTALACKDAHVDLALATQPALWKTPLSPEERKVLHFPTSPAEKGPGSADELRGALDAWNEEVRSTAAREGAVLVDVARAELVPRNLTNFEDDLELTKDGHALFARAVVSVVFADKPAARRP